VLKKYLTGLSIPQQYICVAKETLESPLRVILADDPETDVTDSHIFLGYKPLIIALKTNADQPGASGREKIMLKFRPGNSTQSVASLTLKRICSTPVDDTIVTIYQGEEGKHRLISDFHQTVNSMREKIRKDVPGNIPLEGNLYEMVRIAYSVPRSIFVITVMEGDQMNMFPTDLHGPISKMYYMSSLRKNGKANAQIERIGKLVLSRVDAAAFKHVYALGKNHMKDLRPIQEFECATIRSVFLNYPLPAFALDYIELKRTDSIDLGVHRIHTYEILGQGKLREGATLSHLHQYYVQWRINNNLRTDVLLR
jgi:flavin reductase (DIM6/NTAB) family NADH-FMN oxidoreductase RutF